MIRIIKWKFEFEIWDQTRNNSTIQNPRI